MAHPSRQFVLAARPQGRPTTSDLDLVDVRLPDAADGEVLVRNTALSVDPYMRPRMDDRPSYIPPYQLGVALDGGAVGTVVESRDPARPVGTRVRHGLGWRDVALLPGRATQVLPDDGLPASYHLGILGMPGFTAYAGLRDVAELAAGDVLFVSGAAGAVGSLAGQFGRLLGASRVVGSAGSAAKVRFVVDDLGFDACFSYRDGPVKSQLEAAAPDGIDVYFDNVGGEHFAAAVETLRRGGRIALCGVISDYDSDPSERTLSVDLFQVVAQRLRVRGFISTDHEPLREEFRATVTGWLRDGRLVYRETVTPGIENMATAFLEMLSGGNVGKAIVAP